jgi:hypothetical protein
MSSSHLPYEDHLGLVHAHTNTYNTPHTTHIHPGMDTSPVITVGVFDGFLQHGIQILPQECFSTPLCVDHLRSQEDKDAVLIVLR